MKQTIKFFYHKLGKFQGTSITIFPTIEYRYLPYGNFIEQGVHTSKHIIEFKFLMWGVGFSFFKNYDDLFEECPNFVTGDEPVLDDYQPTSVPEKQIKDI